MRSTVGAGVIRRELIELCSEGRVHAAYARLMESGFEAAHHPSLWELLERRAMEMGDAPLAHELRRELLAADVAGTEIVLHEARHEIEHGRLRTARTYLEHAFGPLPKVTEARILLGAALAPDERDRAIELLGAAENGSEADMLWAIDALRGMGELRRAMTLCVAARKRYPQNGSFSNRLGWLAESVRDFGTAREIAKSQLGGDSDTKAQALNRLVRLSQRTGDNDAALAFAADLLRHDTGPLQKLRLARILRLPGLIEAVTAALPEQFWSGQLDPVEAEKIATYLLDEGQVGLVLFLWQAGLPIALHEKRLLERHGFGREGDKGLPTNMAEAISIKSPDLLFPLFPERRGTAVPAGWAPALRLGDRILIVNSVLAAGGAERQFLMVARALVEAGIQPDRVHAALFSIEGDRGHDHFEGALRATGIQVHDLSRGNLADLGLPERERDCIALMPARLRSDVLALLGLARDLRPAVIHGWQDRAAIASGLVSQFLQTPRTVLSMRNMRPKKRGENADWISRSAYQAILAEPSVRITANAQEGARDYEDWLQLDVAEVSILANAVDQTVFRPRPTPRQQGEAVRLLGVFRLTENKRPLLWLETVAALEANHGIKTVPQILGTGPLEGQIRARAAELGLDHLRLDPPVNDPSEAYRQSDALLLMSSVEGTPNVILEAQACGLPVAACRVGGVAEALYVNGPGGGLLLDAETSVQEAAARIAAWLPGTINTPDDARIDFIHRRYSTRALARSLLGLYGAPT
ncbi:MAG: glycosyltransferase [Pseudomonadota bacterium]